MLYEVITPAILKGDIADVSQLTDNLLTFCIDPLCDLISEETIRKRYGETEYLKGNFMRIDTTCIKHIDIFSIAEKIDKLISSGMYNIVITSYSIHYTKLYDLYKNQPQLHRL